jgi:chromate transport protein ChrA
MKDLCWALPGPTVIQLLVSLTMLLTKSPLVGFISFIIFTIPSVLVLSMLGWLAARYATPHTEFPTQVKLVFLGFLASAAAIMMSSFINNFKQHYQNPAKLIIIISSAVIFLNWPSSSSITFCLVVGAIISLYMEIETKKKMSSKSENLLRDAKLSWIFGKNSLVFLVTIYIILWIWFEINPQSQYVYTFVFYFVGCFVIGPISTIFAYFYANFFKLNLIDP